MRSSIVFCGLLLAAASACAEESRVNLDWLKLMTNASHQTNYSGVFVYQYDDRVKTSRITHVVEPDSEYERLESLDGPKREIIRHHGQAWSYSNHKVVPMDGPRGRNRFPSLLPEQLSALSENYQIKEIGTERVAGYNAQVVLFHPHDSLRYAHKIWLHADTGLLLRAVVLNDRNQTIEQYTFTQLQVGGDIDRSWIKQAAALTRNAGAADSTDKAKEVTPVNSGWVVDSLPSGFKKTMEIQRPSRDRHVPITQLVFSDGLSAISVFIENADADEDDAEGLSSRGALNLYRKVMDLHVVTVVGEVPPRTVMQVLDSVRYNGKRERGSNPLSIFGLW
ncbi:MAG TPA: MucB/RseB C-terminal domain-containing protein [Gallionella sp.]|nr:MucB/RseB C-terminal domain-containing protein [Gallionella sp.]